MKYKFKVKRAGAGGKRSEESGEIVGPNAFGMALDLANYWATGSKSGTVTILRADTTSINAGKFFLHLIIKA